MYVALHCINLPTTSRIMGQRKSVDISPNQNQKKKKKEPFLIYNQFLWFLYLYREILSA